MNLIFLVDAERRAHATLDVEGSHVLPVLLEQRDQKVDGQVDVGTQLFLGHANVADSDSQAQDLEIEILIRSSVLYDMNRRSFVFNRVESQF